MLNIALFGAPGAGKGTQSRLLMEKYNLVYIATGDMLRREIAEGSDLGLNAREILEKGGLVSDEIIVQIIEKTITTNHGSGGFLFDGFPRTFVQAYILEGLLLKLHTSLTCLLSLDVPREECARRLLDRAKTSGRSDDTEEVINYRLREYEEKTAPVADFYTEKGIYVSIPGLGEVDEVYQRLEDAVEGELKKKLFNIVLLGYPGSGRRTQARMLSEKYNLATLATGAMLLKEIQKGSQIGKIAKPIMEVGEFVPDEIVIRLIEKHIRKNPEANGFIFQGFPRTIVQAYILDGLLTKVDSSLSIAIALNLPTLELIKRLDERGRTPHRMSYDLNTSTIIHRLEEHEEKSQPLVNYYKKQKKLSIIDGNTEPEEVFRRLSDPVKNAWRKAR